jgi:hypothetical protein
MVAMANFIGDPAVSPFAAIVRECDASVFKSKLLQLAVQYKWETNCCRLVSFHLLWHLVQLVLAAMTMVATTHAEVQQHISSSSGGSAIIDWLQISNMAVVFLSLGWQLVKYSRLTWQIWSNLWNGLDVVSGGCLAFACAMHFAGDDELVQSFGGFGVSLKFFGILDYLRSFRSTGSLVRMIMVIGQDIGPFIGVLSVVVAGAMFYFVIDLPENAAWTSNPVTGLATPAVTMIRLTLGDFYIQDYSKASATAMFIAVTFFVMILMLNLLIAIMQDSYDKVKEREAVEGLHEKAKTIVVMELLHPGRQSFPTYMHIAEPESDMTNITAIKAQRDHGMSGRIADRLAEEMSERLASLEERADARAEALEGRLDELGAMLATLLEEKSQKRG